MLRSIFLFILVTYAYGSPVPYNGRVVNGTDAKEGEIPYIVSLRRYGSHSCGGSILDELHILTAAHCVSGSSASSLSIQYGTLEISSNDFQSVPVEKVYAHEYFSYQNDTDYDIAVLKLQSPIPMGENAQPVILPEQDEAPPANVWAVLAGWGLPYSGGGVMKKLQRVDILAYSDEDCRKAHGSSVNPSHHVCAGVPEGGKGQCSGDSGGPLVAEGKQIGAVSWSIKPCAVKGYPGVYARVASYSDWINEKRQL